MYVSPPAFVRAHSDLMLCVGRATLGHTTSCKLPWHSNREAHHEWYKILLQPEESRASPPEVWEVSWTDPVKFRNVCPGPGTGCNEKSVEPNF